MGGAMRERPIIFKAEMVRAILEGRKTQTRRIVKPTIEHTKDNTPRELDFVFNGFIYRWASDDNISIYQLRKGLWHQYFSMEEFIKKRCPYGKVGNSLWVRETWVQGDNSEILYKADPDTDFANECEYHNEKYKWKP
jgi:hypothetical protein